LKIASTRMMLQLAGHSVTRPYGVVEDVLVKVCQFTFPVDFVIMDIEEDSNIPLILGHPFMLIEKCVVDMENENLEMIVEDQKATFNLFEAIKHPSDNKTCFKVEAIEQEVDLDGWHLKLVFLEQDEVKPVVNPVAPSIVLPGPRRVKARTTPDAPPAPPSVIPPPTTSSIASKPFSSSSQQEHLVQMMQSLHHGHCLVTQNLHQLSIHLSMEAPLMTPKAFLQKVA